MNKELYKVSVIVAIYNSEKFLDKCISSIINQTYTNIEIILVDDGSPDNSGSICDRYAETDKRVIVIHKKNGGTCEARNFGLERATGDFIVIVDGDDWLSVDYIEYMIGIINQTKTKIAMSTNIFTTRDQVQIEQDRVEQWTSEKAVSELLYPRIAVGPWNKIYSAELLKKNNITFSTKWSGEGLYFATKAVQHTDKIGVGHRKVYNYRMNNAGSGLTNYNVVMGINSLENIFKIRDELLIRTPMVYHAVDWHIWKNYNFTLMLIVATKSEAANRQMYKECKVEIRKRLLKTIIFSDISVIAKIKMFINGIFPIRAAKRAIRKSARALKKDILE